MMRAAFALAVYYLPVFLPLSLAVFSVITRILAGGMKKDLRSALKVYNDIVLAIISFLFWGLITYMQTGKIELNPQQVLTFPNLIVLFILDLILLVTAALVSNLQWQSTEGGWPATKKERVADIVMLLVTVCFFLTPLFIYSTSVQGAPAVQKGTFRVIVPYKDDSIAERLGRAKWGDRELMDVLFVEAKDADEAKQAALIRFKQSGRNQALYGKGDNVDILQDSVAVVPYKADSR
jgi:hypothetical protein